jgi:transposase
MRIPRKFLRSSFVKEVNSRGAVVKAAVESLLSIKKIRKHKIAVTFAKTVTEFVEWVESEVKISLPAPTPDNGGTPPSKDNFRGKNTKDEASNKDTEGTLDTETEGPEDKKTREKLKTEKKRKPGGQKGSKGSTLLIDPDPTEINELHPDEYKANPSNFEFVKTITRQVQDLEIKKVKKNYVLYVYKDKTSGRLIQGNFPPEVKAPVQFGPVVKLIGVFCKEELQVPYIKISQFLDEICGIPVSPGAIAQWVSKIEDSDMLQIFKKAVANKLINAPVKGADESMLNALGKLVFSHHIGNNEYHLAGIHAKRGKEAMNALGILPECKGTVLTDCFSSYSYYDNFQHAYCLQHILRDLKRAEEMDQKWSVDMKDLLLKFRKLVNSHKEVPAIKITWASKQYDRICEQGKLETAKYVNHHRSGEKKRGRIAQPFFVNLLKRLESIKDGIMRYISDPAVPFSNNWVERPLRSLKLRVKISGCFRSIETAGKYLLLWSYIQTSKNQGLTAAQAIKKLLEGVIPDYLKNMLDEENLEERSNK